MLAIVFGYRLEKLQLIMLAKVFGIDYRSCNSFWVQTRKVTTVHAGNSFWVQTIEVTTDHVSNSFWVQTIEVTTDNVCNSFWVLD